jgi:predicted CXXCH cytochrome family protein
MTNYLKTTVMLAVLALVAVGCEGAAGKNGTQGLTGATGETGLQGTQGDPGKDGADGTNGTDGLPGTKGDQGDPGTKGDKGDTGADGNVASAKGTLSGTVNDKDGKGIQGATVTVTPVGQTATTGADGAFELKDLPVGAYSVAFEKAGFLPKTVAAVGIVALNTTTVTVALEVDPAAGKTPTITVTSQHSVGFGKAVDVQATVVDEDNAAADLKFAWTQTAGRTVVVAGAATAKLSFTTKAVSEAKVIELARFGVLGFTPDDVDYAFELAVTDPQGHVGKATVTVTAAEVASSLRNVPNGVVVYLQGDDLDSAGKDKTEWAWTLSAPVGSTAKLDDAATQFPHFTPDVKGTYKLAETKAAKTMDILAGTWTGVMVGDDMCTVCHDGSTAADKFTGWKKTAHYSAAQRKLDGVSGAYFPKECMACHSVGWSPVANNGGFDDVAATSNWIFDKPAAGTWAKLLSDKPELAKLAGIQCENCHGPQSSSAHKGGASRVSFSNEVCAACHQEEPYHYKPEQMEGTGHSNAEIAVTEASWENRNASVGHCGRCHAAQGFAKYAKQLELGYSGNLTMDGKLPAADGSNVLVFDVANKAAQTAKSEKWARDNGLDKANVQPVTCTACHDPHEATNPAQLRLYNDIAELPNGIKGIKGVGAGALCMACHNTRNGEKNDFVAAPTGFTGPHYSSETDVLYGFNAYFMPRWTPSHHLAIKDTCAGCHVAIPTDAQAAKKQASNHAFRTDTTICKKCHTNVDGEGYQEAVHLQMTGLEASITSKVKALVVEALAAGKKVYVRANDPVTDYYSSPKDPTVEIKVAPESVMLEHVHGQISFRFVMKDAIEVPWVTAAGADAGKTNIKELYCQSGTIKVVAVDNTSTTLTAPASTVMKAIWNYDLLHSDGTHGVHNPTFYQKVIEATTAALAK